MDAAKKGYIAYTNCTAALAEVVPFGGKFPDPRHQPALVGLPHDRRRRLPDRDRLGHVRRRHGPRPAAQARGQVPPADGRGRQRRQPDHRSESRHLPPAIRRPQGLRSLAHQRDRRRLHRRLPPDHPQPLDQAVGDKGTCVFFFQVIHPDAINGGAFAKGRNQSQNVKAVIEDVLGHGNEKSMLPGQLEAAWAKHVAAAGGLLFSKAEVDAFNELATEAGQPLWDTATLKSVTI